MNTRDALDPTSSIVDTIWVQRILAGIRARDEPYDIYLKEADIEPDILYNQHEGVALNRFIKLFQILISQRQDEALGLLSRPFKYGSLALIANYALNTGTLGQAIQRTIRGLELLQDDFSIKLYRHDNQTAISIVFHNTDISQHSFLHEMLLIVYSRFFSWLVGGNLTITQFNFSYSDSDRPTKNPWIYPAPPNFNCDQTSFWLISSELRNPVSRNANDLRKYIAQSLANIIFPNNFDQSYRNRIRHQLYINNSWPPLSTIARALNISKATLQRRLMKERTSFREIRDELRCEIAVTRLSTSSVTVDCLAYELGFADETAFQRAFKHWTGLTPGNYRKPHRLSSL